MDCLRGQGQRVGRILMPRFHVDMGSIVHSVDAASYHIKDGFVTFKNGDDVPIASFATIHVLKVEQEGAVTEAANQYPPQVPPPGPGDWTTPGFGWEMPALPPEITAATSFSSAIQPVEAQSWQRWTDVWRPAPDSAAPTALPRSEEHTSESSHTVISYAVF